MRTIYFVIFLIVVFAWSVDGQVTTSPTANPAKLSELLAKKLDSIDLSSEAPRETREKAYAAMMDAQRYIWRLNYQRSQSARLTAINTARASLQKALDYEPRLAEAYVALAEMSVIASPSDLDEAIALASLAIRFNKDSLGGHKLLARLFTRKSGLIGTSFDPLLGTKAIGEWAEVARLDPRNAEAWSYLARLYERAGQNSEQIDALKHLMASATSVDVNWSRQILGTRAEDLSPENAVLRLASALIKGGRIQEAVTTLCQELADNPDNTEAMALLKQSLRTADAKTAAGAAASLRQVVMANPNDLTLLAFLAEVEAKLGRADDAVRLLSEAITRMMPTDRPAAANLQVSIGDIYVGAGNTSEAIAAYQKAFAIRGLDQAGTLDPDEREFALAVFDRLIRSAKRSNRIADAKSYINKARTLLGKDDRFADDRLIALYRETGDRAGALTAVKEVRTRRPDDITLLRLEAMLLAETGQVDQGADLIKQRMSSASKVLTRPDDDFSNYLYIFQLYNEAGRGAEALAAAEQALAAASNEERRQIARIMMATANQTAGKYDEAETILRDILKQSPNNPIAMNNLGYFLLERDEKYSEALQLIEQALRVEPNNPSYLDSLGWAYFKLGRLDDASRALQAALDIDESSGTIQEHLGDVYRKMGNALKAREAWQRAAQLFWSTADVNRVRKKLSSLD
jgi:tetratricopeptide (TPR) repeat protein